MRHQPGDVRREDSAALLARLAQDAYAWGRTLESALAHLSGGDVFAHALAQAERDVMLVEPGGAQWDWPAGFQSLITYAAARGCRVRLLTGRPVSAGARQVTSRLRMAGAEVRTGHTPEWAMLTADMVAVLRAQADDPAAVTVLGPANGALFLRDLADVLWAGARGADDGPVPRAPQAALAGAPDAQVDSRILELLAEGAKDETIARLLGISLRTCRRRIAEIMAGLNAVSRFQAGVNAVRLGLASPEKAGQRR